MREGARTSGYAAALALLAFLARADGVRPIVLAAGVLALGLSAFRAVVAPGPDGFLHSAHGVFVALAGAVTIIAGAVLAGVEVAGDRLGATSASEIPRVWPDRRLGGCAGHLTTPAARLIVIAGR